MSANERNSIMNTESTLVEEYKKTIEQKLSIGLSNKVRFYPEGLLWGDRYVTYVDRKDKDGIRVVIRFMLLHTKTKDERDLYTTRVDIFHYENGTVIFNNPTIPKELLMDKDIEHACSIFNVYCTWIREIAITPFLSIINTGVQILFTQDQLLEEQCNNFINHLSSLIPKGD